MNEKQTRHPAKKVFFNYCIFFLLYGTWEQKNAQGTGV